SNFLIFRSNTGGRAHCGQVRRVLVLEAKGMKRALLVLLVVALAGGAAARYLFFLLLERPGPAPPAPIRIDVAAGERFRTTAAKLEEARLVPSALALTLWA